MQRFFLSHSHADHELAEVFKQLVEDCFPGHFDVRASSAAPSEGGISAGSDWLEWIKEQVSSSPFTAILLTPRSVDKPWLMWEAGAVSGVSLATNGSSTVIPLVFRLAMEQVPSPLRSRQAARGDDHESIKRVLETLNKSVALKATLFDRMTKSSIPGYLQNVAQAFADTPPPLTESSIDDWLDRIAYFEDTDRRSEIGQLHKALLNVFAGGNDDTPLDVRLHRRLGDIYLFSKHSKEAAHQYDLALRLSPRDIFLWHKKGLALLEAGDEVGAEEMLGKLLAIDPSAIRMSTEVAGLQGRLLWQKYRRTHDRADLRAARDAYGAGLAHNPNSHYMADNVGQLSLLLGENDVARDAFSKGLAALERTGDAGYWAVATRASCLFGLQERDRGRLTLQTIPALRPEPAALDSIVRGLRRLHEGLGSSADELEELIALLNGNGRS